MMFWGAPKNMSSSPYAGIIFSTRVGVCGPLLSVMVLPRTRPPPLYAGIIFNTRIGKWVEGRFFAGAMQVVGYKNPNM